MVAARPTCPRCRRPVRVCYCAALPHLPTATRVVFLQHPRERDMPIGTARMARLCLPNSELHVGVDWGRSEPLARALADPARPPILLSPGPDARDLLADPPRGPVTLVVVDGTWSQAHVVVRDNPVLRALPRYAFTTPEPSRYRIRREPRPEYCSTIEAVMHALGALEGDPERFRALLDPLDAMVAAQLAHLATPVRRTRRPRPRPALRDRLPPALTTRFEALVCVAGEVNAWPYATAGVGARDAEREDLVHWVAARPATGERFAMIAAPARALAPGTAFHAALAPEALAAAPPRDEVLAAFGRFVAPTDVIASWGTFAPALYEAAGGALPAARVDLRAVAQRLLANRPFGPRRLGELEAYAASLGEVAPPETPGRAARRLAAMVHVVRAWRDGRA